MLDLFFGTHIGGWQAMVQFFFWTALAMTLVLRWMRKQNRGH